jgi:hypothetical protein
MFDSEGSDLLRFQFCKLELKKLNWRDSLRQENPVAAALLSKMGYRKEEKVRAAWEWSHAVFLPPGQHSFGVHRDEFRIYVPDTMMTIPQCKLEPDSETDPLEITVTLDCWELSFSFLLVSLFVIV